jgi:hypothetical protein
MAPHLDAAQHLLIKTLLMRGFETKLPSLANEASPWPELFDLLATWSSAFYLDTVKLNVHNHATQPGYLLRHYLPCAE